MQFSDIEIPLNFTQCFVLLAVFLYCDVTLFFCWLYKHKILSVESLLKIAEKFLQKQNQNDTVASVYWVTVVNVSVYSLYFGSWNEYYFLLIPGGQNWDDKLEQYSKDEPVLADSAHVPYWLNSSQPLVKKLVLCEAVFSCSSVIVKTLKYKCDPFHWQNNLNLCTDKGSVRSWMSSSLLLKRFKV